MKLLRNQLVYVAFGVNKYLYSFLENIERYINEVTESFSGFLSTALKKAQKLAGRYSIDKKDRF